MARVSGSIPNFINGVSQQAMALRMASQGDLQLNAYSTVVDGLIKRPPMLRRAMLTGSFVDVPIHSHPINRDAFERYYTVWSKNGVRVFDLSGGERQVNYSGGKQYLQYDGNLPRPPYRTTTIGDFTYMTNTQRTVRMDENILEPAQPYEAMVYVMAGNYGKTYNILIDGNTYASYSTPDGTSGAQSPGVDTAYIARRLATGETKDLGLTVNDKQAWAYKASDRNLTTTLAGLGFTITTGKGVVYLKRNAPFTVTVEDGFNGHAMKAIQYSTQDFSDLPAYGPHGVAVQIRGSVTTQYDDYYVRFKGAAPTGISQGEWIECTKPGSKLSFAGETMPHALVRQKDGTFTFGPVKWEPRRCGDEITSPYPSFVDNRIGDIFWFKNRLGFLSGENTILGRHGGPFDFWKTTATVGMDDDPIDVASSESDVSELRAAVGFADRLILFADQSQAMLAGGENLTYKTVSIKPSTRYSMSSSCRPTVNGDHIYFPVKRGQHSMVREYVIDPASELGRAEDITGNVPNYLKGDIIKMDSSTHEDVVIVQTDGFRGLYVYKYFFQDRQKVQASWSEWTFPGVTKILDFWFIDSVLFVAAVRSDGSTWLQYVDIQPGGVDDDMNFIVNLDHRTLKPDTAARTYDPITDRTRFTGDVFSQPYTLVSAPGGPVPAGLLLHALDVTPTGWSMVGDMRNQPIFAGLDYEMRYRLSTIYVRQQSSVSGIPVVRTEGRLQLIRLLIQYAKTAYLRAEVSPMGMQTRSYATNGRLMGDPRNRADTIVLGDGVLNIPILSKNDRVSIDLVNDSYLPTAVLSAEWIANYIVKTQRI